MRTICAGYRDKENNIVKCGVLIKDHDSDTKALLGACELSRDFLRTYLNEPGRSVFWACVDAIALANQVSHGMCEGCCEKFKETLKHA